LGVLDGPRLSSADCAALERVAEALGSELGWEAARVADEVRGFAAEAEAEGIGVR
jgi:hypothetical protein